MDRKGRLKMNDINVIVGYIITALAMVTTVFLYVLVTLAVNDMACASLEKPYSIVSGKWIVKTLALCWW